MGIEVPSLFHVVKVTQDNLVVDLYRKHVVYMKHVVGLVLSISIMKDGFVVNFNYK